MSIQDNNKPGLDLGEPELGRAIKMIADKNIGVLDSEFLGQSLTVLNPRTPICVSQDEPIGRVLELLSANNISSIVVVDDLGKIAGIFTERDCIRKALTYLKEDPSRPVSDFMTKDPIAQPPDISVAYALNLMSHGGFRHIPLVDEENHPVGVVSIRDLVDYIASSLVDDLLNFQTLDV